MKAAFLFSRRDMGTHPLKLSFLKASLFTMGISGVISQIVLLRELLVSYLGNELTLGVILANWLVLEAIGSYASGRTVEKVKRKEEIYILFQLIFSLAFPVSVYLSRVFKGIPGEAVGLGPIFYSSFLILLPVSLPRGALFTLGSRLYSEYCGGNVSSIGRVYILETLGTILGGVLITYVLIQHFNSFEIALMVSLLSAATSVLLLWPGGEPLRLDRRTAIGWLSILFVLFYVLLLLTGSERIQRSSIRTQWKDMNVLHYENSVYGNMMVAESENQFTFFNNGIPVITTPVPDVGFFEDLVHFPMLLHDQPESVLILGGGAGGLLHEVLKHPVTRIDYVELDPLLLKLVKQFSTPMTRSELADPRVRIHTMDGRLFIQETPVRFDIIFVGLSAPQELQTNRFFSSEFFSIVKQKMNPDGIFTLTLPGSLTYLSRELKDLNGCIFDTLKKAFSCVRVIPGETNLYLASNSGRLERETVSRMIERLEARRIQTKLITRGYLADRLDDQWQKWFLQSLEGRALRINSDFHPLGVFFSLTHWNALFSPRLNGIFQGFEKFSMKLTLAALAAFSFLMGFLFFWKPRASIQSVSYSIFTTGLTGMIFTLAIIFTYQTLYGYLYRQIGLLVTLFMAGIASGSLLMTGRLKKPAGESLLFLGTELGLILFSFLLPLLFSVLARFREGSTSNLPEVAFWCVSFVSGSCMGLQFPLAVKIYLDHLAMKGTVGQTAGLIYGADLLGGFFGGLLGGVLFLPVLGLKETCLMMAMIKMSSFLLFLLFVRNTRLYPPP